MNKQTLLQKPNVVNELVLKSDGNYLTTFENQDYFKSIKDWLSYDIGDIFWLENRNDYGKDDEIVGLFVGFENGNPVIRVLPSDVAIYLIEYCTTMLSANESDDPSFYMKYISIA